jgi:hypothetical protein
VIFNSGVSYFAQKLLHKDEIVRSLTRLPCEKTSPAFLASHARHLLVLPVLDSSLRSEDKFENAGSLENAGSAKKLGYPKCPWGVILAAGGDKKNE